ncbi:MAG: M60 family metallopeptidase [Bacteroidales bacterium]|nr:M60 family metallopeptidase [Bacteroidales bacterium]
MKKIHILLSALLLSCVFSLNAQEKFLTAVPTISSLTEEIPGNIKIKPQANGTFASSYQSGEEIAKSFDDNMSTIYHSSWGATTFPVTLQYAFPENQDIDYLVYRPRSSGLNGNFKEVDVFYKLRGAAEEVKYGSYDFKGSNDASGVQFSETLKNVEYIKFSVKSGAGDGNGFASCAEMEFYKRNPQAFNYKDIFTDGSCSEIKPGVTIDDIKAIQPEIFRKLAEDIYYGQYDDEFRIQEYESYIQPEITSAINKTNKYGKRDNPTGIYVTKGENLIVLVPEIDKVNYPTIFIQTTDDRNNGTSIYVEEGINKIVAPHDGLVYVMFYTPTGTEKPVKINFLSGGVNGYFDIEKHTAEDWEKLIANAPFSHFDMKGKYCLLNFETSAFRSYTKKKGLELLKAYDELVRMEMDFMGLFKYNKVFPTRMHFQVVYGEKDFMYATDYFTGYQYGTQNSILDYDKLMSAEFTNSWDGGVAWGPAHEVGHCNQTRPGLKWLGMTEVTNNIHSQYITTAWGQPSRLNDEFIDGYGNRYNKAIETIIKAGKPHNDPEGDVFCKLVPFWQLKLYIHDVLGQDDFYKDIYERVRTTPNLTAGTNGNSLDGQYQLDFTKMVCEISGYDFTEFFQDWGFYTPFSAVIEDYAEATVTVTEAGAAATKAAIAAMNLPKPPVPAGKNLYEITDKNKMEFKVE